jgi:hypothetical protein
MTTPDFSETLKLSIHKEPPHPHLSDTWLPFFNGNVVIIFLYELV